MALLHTLPADDGFRMPAEFDEQQAVVMICPSVKARGALIPQRQSKHFAA